MKSVDVQNFIYLYIRITLCASDYTGSYSPDAFLIGRDLFAFV